MPRLTRVRVPLASVAVFSTSRAPQTTSVGQAALERFQRPGAWQDAPARPSAREGIAG